ncbi:MAG TPA: hypothetical protein VFW40_01165, partial [Capsulimonadaceae bacterium]|nr:hypothetical protein [Capsulimonadaceae bacterium]
STLSGRFAAAFGEKIATPHGALTHLEPIASRVANACAGDLIAMGIMPPRARAILALAQAVADGSLRLEPSGDIADTLAGLKSLPGVGEWTAQYIAMRALSWPDAFPHTDLGLLRAMGESNPKRALEMAEAWRPWRSYAAMHLWTTYNPSKPQALEEMGGSLK